MKRAIIIDWLEVFALEPTNLDAEYFRAQEYEVSERCYGTPQYREVLTIHDAGQPFIEIRRNPYSLKSEGGIFEKGACHLRLSNCVLYGKNPIDRLREFMCAHGYRYKNISRIDIACDFNEFDNNLQVQDFVNAYMRGEISKVNQGRLSAHGSDMWIGRQITSLKWGANSSPNTTKLYNKSKELRESGEKKIYIRKYWEDAGLDQSRDVWRVEFSLTSQFQTLKNKKNGELIKKGLSDYDTPERLMYQFFILYARYFDFRHVQYGARGSLKRKYDCERIKAIVYNPNDIVHVPKRNASIEVSPNRTLKILANKLILLKNDTTEDSEIRYAAQVIISWMLEKYNTEYNQIKSDKLAEMRQKIDLYRAHQEPDMLVLTHPSNPLTIKQAQQEYWDYCQSRDRVAIEQYRAEQQQLKFLMQKYGIVEMPRDCPF